MGQLLALDESENWAQRFGPDDIRDLLMMLLEDDPFPDGGGAR